MKINKMIFLVLFSFMVMSDLQGSRLPGFLEPKPRGRFTLTQEQRLALEAFAKIGQQENSPEPSPVESSSAVDSTPTLVLTVQELVHGAGQDLKEVLEDVQDFLDSHLQSPKVESKKDNSIEKK